MTEISRHERMPLSEILRHARSARSHASSRWVALCSGVFGFGIALWLWSSVEFQYRNPYEIVSRISIAKYPKHQDPAGYILAFVFVIGAIILGWWVWCATARWLIERWRPRTITVETALQRSTWPFLGLAIGLLGITTGNWSLSALIVWPLIVTTLLGILALQILPLTGGQPKTNRVDSLDHHPNPPLGRLWPGHSSPLRTLGLTFVIPILLYAWLYDGYLIHYRIDLHHEGEILGPWQAIREGAVPYRDLYLQHGLFQNVGKPWLAEQWYGVSLASLRMTEAWIAPLGQIALYFLGLAVFRSWISAILLVLVAAVTNIPVIDRQSFGLLAIALLAYAMRSQLPSVHQKTARQTPSTKLFFVAAGACTTLSLFYSAEVGIFTLVACGGILLLRALTMHEASSPLRSGPLLFYLLGVAVILVPFGIALWGVDALQPFFLNTWHQIAYQNIQWGRPFPALYDALKSWNSTSDAAALLLGKWFQWYLPVLVYLVAAGNLALRFNRGQFWRDSRNTVWLLILLSSITFFTSALGRADHYHLKYGSLFMWLWIGIGLEETLLRSRLSLRSDGRISGRIQALFPPLLFAGLACFYVGAVHQPISAWQDRIDQISSGRFLPRMLPTEWPRVGPIRIGGEQSSKLREVVSFIEAKTQAHETIFDFSSQPTYYFLANRRNPSRFPLTAYASTPAMQKEVITDLEREQTPLVIYRSNGYLDRLDTVPFTKRNALIEKYLRKNYRPEKTIRGTVILLRNPKNREKPFS